MSVKPYKNEALKIAVQSISKVLQRNENIQIFWWGLQDPFIENCQIYVEFKVSELTFSQTIYMYSSTFLSPPPFSFKN